MLGLRDLLLFGLTVVTASCLGIGHDANSGMGFSHGTVATGTPTFGKVIIGSGVSNDSAESPAEQPNGFWSGDQAKFQLAEAKLKRLGSSVHCGNDTMTLRVPGPRMPHFLVDRGVGSPVPVSEIPASCGISVKRVRRDVSFSVPFRGCPVRQQSGRYILSLIIMGAPVQASCPASSPVPMVSAPLPKVSCLPTGMIVSLGFRADTVKIKVDGLWQPLLLEYSKCGFTLDTIDGALVVTAPFTGKCWVMKDTERHLPLLYVDREVILSCPLTLPTADPTGPGRPVPGRPVRPGRPVPGRPVRPGRPVPGRPVRPGRPVPGRPVRPGRPVPGRPVRPGRPVPGRPVRPGRPVPGRPVRPVRPGRPVPGRPVRPGRPVPGRPVRPGRPVPGRPVRPVRPGRPVPHRIKSG